MDVLEPQSESVHLISALPVSIHNVIITSDIPEKIVNICWAGPSNIVLANRGHFSQKG